METQQIFKTQKQAANYCGVSTRTIHRWVKAGMPLTKEGFYSAAQLHKWQAEHGRKSVAAKQTRIPKQVQSIIEDLAEIQARLGRLLD